MKRAITNLIQNAISHNEKGCHIFISVFTKQESCIVVVEDDGIGISDKQIEELNNAPHYMISDQSTMEQRHGLGLLLVKQITLSHNGEMKIGHSCYGGFSVTLEFPIHNVN
ncbi:ATP-binding protein [Lactococcus lactis]|nr:ATP-binding protein [Lactococcus lactis]